MKNLSFSIKLLVGWYSVLIIFYAVAPIAIGLLDAVIGILMAALALLALYLGVTTVKTNLDQSQKRVSSLRGAAGKRSRLKLMRYLAIASPFLSIYSAWVYTGSLPHEVMLRILEGGSNYISYQVNFSDSGLGELTFSKLPVILALLILKVSVIYNILAYRLERRFVAKYVVLLPVFSYFYFSQARGTSFEIFELGCLFLYAWVLFGYTGSSKLFLGRRAFVIYIAITVMVGLYLFNIESRFSEGTVGFCPLEEMCFDSDSLWGRYFPTTAQYAYLFVSYFSFGFFFNAQYGELLATDVLGYLPFGPYLTESLRPGYVCHTMIDCGAAWLPDLSWLAATFGIVLLLPVIFLIGRMYAYTFLRALNERMDFVILSYMLFLYSISLPVGNFVTASSSTIVIMLGAVLFVLLRATLKRG